MSYLFTEPPCASLFPDEQRICEVDPSYTGPRVYAPRKPQATVLYKLVQAHLETWLAQRREACPDDDPIPAYVEKAFRKYLLCGIWYAGLTKFACRNPDCADPDAVFVALSCRSRGLCPSCGAKYMAKTAMHLEAHVLPRVPYRQFVISVPKRIRCFLKDNPDRFRAVLRITMRAIEAKLRACSPTAPPEARAGAILFPQVFGSSLNAHPHGHLVVTNGVFALDDDGGLTFYHADNFDDAAIAELTETIRRRVLRYLVRQGCLENDDADEMLSWNHHAGFSLDASVHIAEHDRAGLQRLARYCARHPFAKGRLRRAGQEKVIYQLDKPDRHENTQLTLSPLELFDKLAQFVVPPRKHRNIYWGCFAPHSKMRPFVVLTSGLALTNEDQPCASPNTCTSPEDNVFLINPNIATTANAAASAAKDTADATPERKRAFSSLWAVMLAQIYEVLPILCRSCGAEMKPVAVIVDQDSLARICRHQGQPPAIPKLAPARGPPQSELHFPDCDFADVAD